MEGTAKTAMGGSWRRGPGIELFKAMKDKLGAVPIMAEDLGVITTGGMEWFRFLMPFYLVAS